MTTPTPEDLMEAADGAKVSAMMPYIEAEINQAIQTVVNKAMTAITKGELSPDLAQNLWYEYNAHRKLLKNLKTRVTMGVSARENLAPFMKTGE